MATSNEDIGPVIDSAIIESMASEAFQELESVVADVRGMSRRIGSGEATEDERKEFFAGLNEIFEGWVELVANLFAEVGEPPMSDRAVSFYSLVDVNRAVLDMPARSADIMEKMLRTQLDHDLGLHNHDDEQSE